MRTNVALPSDGSATRSARPAASRRLTRVVIPGCETASRWASSLMRSGPALARLSSVVTVLLLTAGSLFSRNVLTPLVPTLGERQALLASRGSMILFAAVAVWLTLGASRSLVEVGLSAYAAIGMLAPGVYFAFLWKRAHPVGILVGIVIGYAALLPQMKPVWDSLLPQWDTGLIAMAVNAAVAAALSLALTSGRRSAAAA